MTKRLTVGGVVLGGGAAVSIQSMCNTKTEDVAATVAQIHALEAAGCEIVRVTVPTMEAALAISAIREQIHIPLVADIHFDYKLALKCIENGICAIDTETMGLNPMLDDIVGFSLYTPGEKSTS